MRGAPKKYLLEYYPKDEEIIFEDYQELLEYLKLILGRQMKKRFQGNKLFIDKGNKVALIRLIHHYKFI